MDLAVAKKVISAPGFQRSLKDMDADTTAALAKMKKNLDSMSSYSSAFAAEYKRDGKAADDAWSDFGDEVTKITFGKARDGRAAMAPCRKWMITFEILETQDARYAAFIDANVAGFLSLLLAKLHDVTKRLRSYAKALDNELVDLDKALRKAKKELSQAEYRRLINGAITVVSVLLPLTGGLGALAVAGTLSLQAGLDYSPGSGKPSGFGIANTAMGDPPGLINTAKQHVRPSVAKFPGISTGLITLYTDTNEIDEARRIVQDLQSRLISVQKSLALIDRFLATDAVHLTRLHDDAVKGITLARSRAAAHHSAVSKRAGLLNDLAKIK